MLHEFEITLPSMRIWSGKWYLNNANIAQGLAGCGWVQRFGLVGPWDWKHPCRTEQVAEDTCSEFLANSRKMALEQACVRMEGHVTQTPWEGPETWLYHLHQRAGAVEESCWSQEILGRRPTRAKWVTYIFLLTLHMLIYIPVLQALPDFSANRSDEYVLI